MDTWRVEAHVNRDAGPMKVVRRWQQLYPKIQLKRDEGHAPMLGKGVAIATATATVERDEPCVFSRVTVPRCPCHKALSSIGLGIEPWLLGLPVAIPTIWSRQVGVSSCYATLRGTDGESRPT